MDRSASLGAGFYLFLNESAVYFGHEIIVAGQNLGEKTLTPGFRASEEGMIGVGKSFSDQGPNWSQGICSISTKIRRSSKIATAG